jgi:mono/diheme cytochrome c family protein
MRFAIWGGPSRGMWFRDALAAVALLTAAFAVAAQTTPAGKDQVKRGEYLSIIGGCNDCHSPKLMTPKGPTPDPARLLSGHPANAQLPAIPAGLFGPDKWAGLTNGDFTAWVGPWGVSFAANLTPDAATGLGAWTPAQFIQSMRTGKHLGVGRDILPPMPTYALAALTDSDLKALFAYLKSLKPIRNQVPAPLPPGP